MKNLGKQLLNIFNSEDSNNYSNAAYAGAAMNMQHNNAENISAETHELGHLAGRPEHSEKPTDLGMMLKVAQGFIGFCLGDGETASESVTKHIVAMQKAINKAQDELNSVGKIGASAKINNNIQLNLGQAFSELEQVIIAMQFYDRISQRLDHASKLLQMSREVEGSGDQSEVKALLDKFSTGLTMEDERVLLGAIREGATLGYAIKSAQKKFDDQAGASDIELF